MFYLRLVLILLLLAFCSIASIPFALWERYSLNRVYGIIFRAIACRICGIRVVVEGIEHARTGKPAVYVANHQSGMDIMLFGSMFPRRTVIIGKREILLIPAFNLFYVLGGNILIDRAKRVRAISGLTKAVERLHERHVSIWIFPEGTRNRGDGQLLPFKKGAFYMATQAKVPLIPVVAGPLDPLISWKERRIRGGEIRVRVLPPIDTAGVGDDGVDQLLKRTRDQMATAFAELVTVPRPERR